MSLLLASIAFAENMWVIAPVEATRWPDAAFVAIKLGQGDEVEVILRDGERARVRKGTDFGWVALSALSATVIDRPVVIPDAAPVAPEAPIAPVAPVAP